MATEKVTSKILKPVDFGLDSAKPGPVKRLSVSQCVRVLRQNWRQGTVGCKDRSEVAFSNKKPWKQKGTGRARSGTKRSPLWRKGGVTFGPQERSRKLKAPKKIKNQAFFSIFEYLLYNDRVVALDWRPNDQAPSTANAFGAMVGAGLGGKKVYLFVSPADIYVQASFANIPQIQLMFFDEPNVFDIACADYVVFLEKDTDLFKAMVKKWI